MTGSGALVAALLVAAAEPGALPAPEEDAPAPPVRLTEPDRPLAPERRAPEKDQELYFELHVPADVSFTPLPGRDSFLDGLRSGLEARIVWSFARAGHHAVFIAAHDGLAFRGLLGAGNHYDLAGDMQLLVFFAAGAFVAGRDRPHPWGLRSGTELRLGLGLRWWLGPRLQLRLEVGPSWIASGDEASAAVAGFRLGVSTGGTPPKDAGEAEHPLSGDVLFVADTSLRRGTQPLTETDPGARGGLEGRVYLGLPERRAHLVLYGGYLGAGGVVRGGAGASSDVSVSERVTIEGLVSLGGWGRLDFHADPWGPGAATEWRVAAGVRWYVVAGTHLRFEVGASWLGVKFKEHRGFVSQGGPIVGLRLGLGFGPRRVGWPLHRSRSRDGTAPAVPPDGPQVPERREPDA